MDDPIKIIFKNKNNARKVQYNTYIYVGDIPKNIKNILNIITDKNLYNTLITLSDKEITVLINFYGDFWYKKFFNTYHLNYIINMAQELPNYKKDLIKKFGNEWYQKHINNHQLIDKKLFRSFANKVKQTNERKLSKKQNADIAELTDLNLNYRTKEEEEIQKLKKTLSTNLIREANELKLQKFISNDNDELEQTEQLDENEIVGREKLTQFNEDQDEDQEEQDNNTIETNDIIEEDEDLEEIEKIYKYQDVIEDSKSDETSKLIQKALDDDKIFKKASKRMVEFNDENDELLFDAQLKNNYKKTFITSQYILKDDTVETIKKKITLSILNNNKFGEIRYIIPSRQYLWCEYFFEDKVEKVMIGQKWIKRSELLQIDVEPNLNFRYYEELRGNLKYLRDNLKRYGSKIKREDDETNILYDYEDYMSNNEIYMLDIYNELGKGYSPRPDIIKNIYEVYCKLYFPKLRSDELKNIINYLNDDKSNEKTQIENIYEIISNDLILENEIVETINSIKLGKQDYKKLFKINYITQSVIHVDLRIKKGKINLFRIFNEFIVNDRYPFVQFQTLDGQIAFKFDEKEIKKYHTKKNRVDLLSKWFENAPYGISFKVKVGESEKFMAIGLNERGRIEYKTQWKEEDMATIEDIRETYKYVENLINKINKEEKNRIQIEIPFEEEYRYAFINSIQKFILPNNFSINHNDLSEFSRYFFPFVALVIEPRKRQSKTIKKNELSKYGTYLRYKRITKYDNQQKIEQRILYFMRNYEHTEATLANEISKQFNITLEKAYDEIGLVKKKYPNIKKSRKVLKKLENLPKNKPPGIGIDIQGKSNDKYKIRISGARNKTQLDRMLDFMNILIYLYVETYLLKKPERQKLKEKLKKLTFIAKRRHKVAEIVEHDVTEQNVKTITKRDQKRLGFKPEKGQNQWSRSCQNSGDNKRRRPQQYTKVEDMLKDSYRLNKKNGFYEKVVRVKDTDGKLKNKTIRTVKLEDIDETGKNGKSIYYACDPKENGEHFYVGFLSKGNNPFGFCMPCCFKKDQLFSDNKNKKDYFLECIGNKKKVDNKTKVKEPVILGDQLYILQDTHKIQEGRLGFLPKDLDFFFNYRLNKTKEIKQNYLTKAELGYYFKMGSNRNELPFLNAISLMLNMPLNEIKQNIIKTLENDRSDLIFTYLNNGTIKERFKTREEFIKFIKTNHYLEFDLMNNLISIPNVLEKDGLNIIIFKEKITKIKKALEKEKTIEDYIILCQNYEENYNITDSKRKNIILIEEFESYNPVVMITKKNEASKDISIDRTFNFIDHEENVINNLLDLYSRNCTGSFLNQMNNKKTMPIAKEIYLILLNLSNKDYHPKYQYIDSRNKCKYIITNNKTIVPTTPSGSILNLMIIKNINNQLIPFDKMKKQLIELNTMVNFNIEPKSVYIEEQKSKTQNDIIINAIITGAKFSIPVELTKKNKNSIDLIIRTEPLYDVIDKEIEKGNQKIKDKRIEEINYYQYKNESYELFRLNFSNYLLKEDNSKLYNTIKDIINQNKDISIKRRSIRKILYKLSDKDLLEIYNKLIIKNQTGGKIIHTINTIPGLNNYQIKNTRDVCLVHTTRDKCNDNVHCRWSHDTCYFATTKKLLIEFINRISEELSSNNLKANEILQIGEYYVSDIADVNNFTQYEGQKVIKSSNTTLKKILKNIFGEENIPQIGKRRGLHNVETDYMQLNIDNPVRNLTNAYVQNIIENNLTIFRAYVNGYYWVKHSFYDQQSRNLGFYNPIQTDLSNYFRSLIVDWLLDKDNQEEINKKLNKYINKGKNDTLIKYVVKLISANNLTSSSNIIELYILSKIHQIPIYVYDDNNILIYLFDNGLIYNKYNKDNFKDNRYKKYHDVKIKNNSINLMFNLLTSLTIPDQIEVIYLK